MIIPSLLPDELARGYLCRVGLLNAQKNIKSIYDLLLNAIPMRGVSEKLFTMADALAELADLTPDMIIARHTLLPFARGVRAAAACIPHRDLRDNFGRAALTFPFRNRADFQFCLKCAEEDIRCHGMTYWRRAHHLKGSVFCIKHGCGLHALSTYRWDVLPEHLREQGVVINKNIVQHALNNPVVHRYKELSAYFAMRTRPFKADSVAAILRERIRMVTSNSRWKAFSLTRLAAEKVGGPWLTNYFPSIPDKRWAGYGDSLGNTLSKHSVPPPTQYYVLAFALLFSTVDEAMSCLEQIES